MNTTTSRDNSIPIRNSELSTFSQCRTKWYWAYQRNLRRLGFDTTIDRGTLGHLALAVARLQPDTATSAAAFAVSDWCTDFKKETPEHTYDHADLSTTVDGVLEQLDRYLEHWGNWKKVHMTEHEVVLEVGGISTVMTIDAIVEDEEGLWVLESKWVKQFRAEEQMELDAQLSLYSLGALTLGYKINGVIVDQIGPIPKVPTLNLDGSMSRRPVGDRASYTRELLKHDLKPAYYEDVLSKLPDTKEFKRIPIVRTEHELKWFAEQWQVRSKDMMQHGTPIYMCDDRMRCSFCRYRELCIETARGGDVEYIVQNQFRVANTPADHRGVLVEMEDL